MKNIIWCCVFWAIYIQSLLHFIFLIIDFYVINHWFETIILLFNLNKFIIIFICISIHVLKLSIINILIHFYVRALTKENLRFLDFFCKINVQGRLNRNVVFNTEIVAVVLIRNEMNRVNNFILLPILIEYFRERNLIYEARITNRCFQIHYKSYHCYEQEECQIYYSLGCAKKVVFV